MHLSSIWVGTQFRGYTKPADAVGQFPKGFHKAISPSLVLTES
jgi:hypothetical protein